MCDADSAGALGVEEVGMGSVANVALAGWEVEVIAIDSELRIG